MEPLYAPWRIKYILAPKPAPADAAVFKQIGESNDDEGNYVVARDRTCYVVLNRYPYTCGHLLVVPYKQTAELNDLTEEEMAGLILMVRRCRNALIEIMKPDGFNVGLNLGKVAGAGITDHIHFHVVPRWNGDTNFMPVIGNTTVLPEALAEVAAKLRAHLTR